MKEFWYESNACWGWVRSISDLKEKIKLQLEENNGIDTVDDFLDESRQITGNSRLNFGTRREHDSDITLRMFLLENNVDLTNIV